MPTAPPAPGVWTEQTVREIRPYIDYLWPNVAAESRENLSTGLMVLIRRGKMTPLDLFGAIVEVAESGRSSLPSAGTIMAQVNARQAKAARERQMLRPLPSGGASCAHAPWAPSLNVAAFVAVGGPQREAMVAQVAPEFAKRLQPWVALVKEIGYRCEHGIPITREFASLDPDYDSGGVLSLANERGRALWAEVGGVGEREALSMMGAKVTSRTWPKR